MSRDLALPDPQRVAIGQIPALLPQIIEARKRCLASRDLPQADELRRRLDAYEHYVADKEARELLLPELRRTEALIGELLGEPHKGKARTSSLDIHQQHAEWFRLMAQHPEILGLCLAKGQRKRAAIIAAIKEATLEMPPPAEGKYRCLVIDPPWPVKKIEREVRHYQAEALDYPTMTLDQIADLPIADLADPSGCHVYLWTTHKFLPASLDILTAWGARYECLMTWVKNVGITPFSWMYSTEHVLFARVGSLPVERKGQRLDFTAPVAGHSVKPAVFYERVVTASPAVRLELFAREPHDGFESWGAEVAA